MLMEERFVTVVLGLISNAIQEELLKKIKEELKEHNISHSTIEIESKNYDCDDVSCCVECIECEHHHH